MAGDFRSAAILVRSAAFHCLPKSNKPPDAHKTPRTVVSSYGYRTVKHTNKLRQGPASVLPQEVTFDSFPLARAAPLAQDFLTSKHHVSAIAALLLVCRLSKPLDRGLRKNRISTAGYHMQNSTLSA